MQNFYKLMYHKGVCVCEHESLHMAEEKAHKTKLPCLGYMYNVYVLRLVELVSPLHDRDNNANDDLWIFLFIFPLPTNFCLLSCSFFCLLLIDVLMNKMRLWLVGCHC